MLPYAILHLLISPTVAMTATSRTSRLILITLLLSMAGPGFALPQHDTNHPRLLISQPELADLRQDIAQDPERLAAWNETRNLAPGWFALTPDALLAYYWGFQEIEELSLLAQLGDGEEAAAAAEAIESTLAWLIDNEGPEPDTEHGALGSALRLHALVWGFDHAYAQADEVDRQAVVDEILIYLQAMSSEDAFLQYGYNPLVSNKGLTLGAQMLLACLLLEPDLPGDPILADARLVGQSLVDKAWSDLFGRDGGYREGIGYMLWSIRTLLPTWEARTRLEGEDLLRASRAQALLEWLAYQMPVIGGGTTLNRNDSNSSDYLLSRHHSLMEWCSSRGEEPGFARWLLRRASGDLGHDFGHGSDPVATILWHAGGAEVPPTLPSARLFTDTGLFVHRQGWPGDPLTDSSLLTIEASTFMGGHAQEDVGQFSFRAMGHGFAIDHGSGATAKQTEAHNLPMADGRGQHNAGASIGTDGTLSLLLDAGFCTALRVDMTSAYSGHSPFNDPDTPWPGWDWSWGYDGGNPMSRAERSLLIFPGTPGELPEFFLEDLLIKDEPGPHIFRWRLHLDEDLSFYEQGDGQWRAASDEGQLLLQLHDPPRAGLSTSLSSFDNGNAEPESQLFKVGLETEVFRFLWQWIPLRTEDEVPILATTSLPEGLSMHSQRGGRERWVLRRDGQTALAVNDDFLDGNWGVIEEDAGQTRTLLIEGKRLRRNGSLLIGLEPSGSAAMVGDTVRLSSPDLSFKLWAPSAQVVVAGEINLPFTRRGEFISGPDHSDPELPDIAALRPPHSVEGLAGGKPPFRIDFARSASAPGRLSIYDIQGRLMRRLTTEAGRPVFSWDGCDARGRQAVSGVYLLRYSSTGATPLRRKLLLLR